MRRVALLARRTPSSSTPETRRRSDLAAAAERSAVIRAGIRSDPCHQSEEAHHARAGIEQNSPGAIDPHALRTDPLLRPRLGRALAQPLVLEPGDKLAKAVGRAKP